MLTFIYTLDYKISQQGSGTITTQERLTIHASLYSMGEKYGVKGLKQAAKTKFDTEIIWIAGRVDQRGCVWTAELLRIIYTSTPDTDRGLRNSCRDNMTPYNLGYGSDLLEALRCIPSLATDVVLIMLESLPYGAAKTFMTETFACHSTAKICQACTKDSRSDSVRETQEDMKAEMQSKIKEEVEGSVT